MNIILGAMILDCVVNANKESSENGAGLLIGLGLIVYLIVKLQTIEQYILQIGLKDTDLIIGLVVGCTILIPIYWSHMDNNPTIWVNMLLRIMIYLDLFLGVAIMVMISDKLGSHPASLIFNIEKVSKYGQSQEFFLSLSASIGYLIIKLLDFICVVGLIPLLQVILVTLYKKILSILFRDGARKEKDVKVDNKVDLRNTNKMEIEQSSILRTELESGNTMMAEVELRKQILKLHEL